MSQPDIDKLLRQIKPISDVDVAEVLKDFHETASQRLCNLVDEETVPPSLEWIVNELTIARYNRIGSENMTSKSVEGYSVSFLESDFAPYMMEIDRYIEQRERERLAGRILVF